MREPYASRSAIGMGKDLDVGQNRPGAVPTWINDARSLRHCATFYSRIRGRLQDTVAFPDPGLTSPPRYVAGRSVVVRLPIIGPLADGE